MRPTASMTSGPANRWPLSLAVLASVTTRLAGIVVVVLVFAAGAAAAPLQTVVAFNPAANETPENLAIARDGTIYVSLAFASEIRRIAPDGAQRTLTIPTVGGITGANGVKVWHRRVYVSNTSTDNILTIPIRPDGEAGQVAVKVPAIEADDFAFAANGDLHVAENPSSELVRVTPSGDVKRLATQANGLNNPSAVAFDPRPGERKQLYITNSAYFGTHPSLEVTATDTVGQRLP